MSNSFPGFSLEFPAARFRRGRSTGSGRTSRAGRRPGRRRRPPPTCLLPSTSSCTDVTRAVLPATKMSWASALRLGRNRTRLPRATRTPFTSTASISGRTALSASGSHQSTPSGISGTSPARRVRITQHTVQARHRLGRHRVTVVDDLRGPRIGGPGLGLLLVGHRHHAQGQDLVDLGAVIQRGVALFGDLGVVVEDDRRDQQHVVGAGRAGQHREAAVLGDTGTPRRPRPAGGSSSETNWPPTTSAMTWVPIMDRAIASSSCRPRRRRRC